MNDEKKTELPDEQLKDTAGGFIYLLDVCYVCNNCGHKYGDATFGCPKCGSYDARTENR